MVAGTGTEEKETFLKTGNAAREPRAQSARVFAERRCDRWERKRSKRGRSLAPALPQTTPLLHALSHVTDASRVSLYASVALALDLILYGSICATRACNDVADSK